jgi:hypothetical protein
VSKGKGKGKGKGEVSDKKADDDDDDEASANGGSMPSDRAIERVLRGEGKALDPSSAMEQAVRKAQQGLDHHVWIDHGFEPVVSKNNPLDR